MALETNMLDPKGAADRAQSAKIIYGLLKMEELLMSNIKRVISMLLAAAMILSMSTFVAFAEDSTTNEEAADAVLSSAAGTELASMPNDDVQYADA